MGEPIRFENVGSLLRPPELLATRERHAAGDCTDAELKRAEDAAVDEAVALQVQLGLDVLTDGEFRRRGWLTHFFESVDGFQMGAGPALPWRDGSERELPGELRAPLRPVVVDKLRWRHSACAEEWVYLRGATTEAQEGDPDQCRDGRRDVRARAFGRRLPDPRGLLRGRRRAAAQRGRPSSSASAASTSSSMPPSTARSWIPPTARCSASGAAIPTR